MRIVIDIDEKDAGCLAYSLECFQEENTKKGMYMNTEICLGVAKGINDAIGRSPSIDYSKISSVSDAWYKRNPRVNVHKEE